MQDIPWSRWLKFILLIWFLIRVIPKPSRAAYPCQRVAAPLASSFVLWLLGAVASISLFKHAKKQIHRTRYLIGGALLILSVAVVWFTLASSSGKTAVADNTIPNAPIGIARGIYPGRVVWVHDPNATDWDGYQSDEPWWGSSHTNLKAVENMMSKSIRSIADKCTEEQAWDAIFKYFNKSRGKGAIGYQEGEKIAIKVK